MNDVSRGEQREPELIDADSLDFGLGVAFAGDGRRPGEGVSAAIERMTGGASRVLLRDDHDAPSPILRLLPAGSAERIGDDGRYQVMGEIARGGLGVVLKGRDRDLGRDVALKVLRPEFAKNDAVLARFIEEAQIGGQLQHPGIVPVYSLGIESEGRPFFAMKLVKGRTLAALLVDRKSPRDGQRRILAVFEQVCRTMAYAHSRRVVHRDLKPSNVMLGAFGEIQVVDWGLAKVLGREDVPSVRPVATDAPEISLIATVRSGSAGSGSLAGSVLGTPGYMSPEQAIGRVEDVDERTDVFALGAILCEILTGQPPFTGEARDQIVLAARANLDDAAARLAKCGADPAIVAVAMKCLAAERGERFHDAGVLADAVTAHLSGIEARARRAEVAAAVARAKAEEERTAATRERVTAAAARGAHRRTIALAAVALTGVAAGVVVWRREAAGESERAARSVAAVSTALAEANAKRGACDIVGALAAAQKAVALAKTGETDVETTAQAARLVTSLEAEEHAASVASAAESKTAALFARLEKVEGDGRTADLESWSDGRAAAFREFGVDVAADDDQTAVAVIRSSSRAIDIAAALDDWAYSGRASAASSKTHAARLDALFQRIDKLADAADPDPYRKRVRDAVRREDLAALRELASHSGVEKLPIRTRAFLGATLAHLGDLKAAYDVLSPAARAHPGDGRTANVLVAVLSSLPRLEAEPGNVDEGVALRIAQLALAPGHRSWEELGYEHSLNIEYDASIVALHEALRFQDCPRALGYLGASLHWAGKNDDAIKAADRAITADPSQTYAYYAHWLRGDVLRQSSDFVHAAESMRKAIELSPAWPGGHSALGDLLYAMNDMKGAAAAYRDAFRFAPKDAYAPGYLVVTLVAANEVDAALAEGKRAVGLFPRDAGVVGAYVWALERDSRRPHEESEKASRTAALDEAIRLCRDALVAAPLDGEFHAQLAEALTLRADLTDDDHGDAISEYRTAVRLEPTSSRIRGNFGIELCRGGEYAEAIDHLRAAIRLGVVGKTNFALSSRWLVMALDDSFAFDEALVEAKKLVEIAPESWESHRSLAVLLFDRGGRRQTTDWTQVLSESRRARELYAKLSNRDKSQEQQLDEDIADVGFQIDPQFPDVVRSGAKPQNSQVAWSMALACCNRRITVDGLRFVVDCLAADPRFDDETIRSLHYNGACLAVMASDGVGDGAAALDDPSRDAWRRRAIAWFGDYVRGYVAQMASRKRDVAVTAERRLRHAKIDPDLSPVRDPEGLAKLSIDDRVAWERLWAEVDRAIRNWSKRKR